MRPHEIKVLFEYAWWATDHLFTTAERISHEQFLAPINIPSGSIRAAFAHIVAAHWIWRQRFALGESPTALPDYSECQTRDKLVAAFHSERDVWREFLETLTEEKLSAQITWKNTRGAEASRPLWLALTHVVNHSTQHNAELAQALTDLGHSPGGIDLIFWAIREGIE